MNSLFAQAWMFGRWSELGFLEGWNPTVVVWLAAAVLLGSGTAMRFFSLRKPLPEDASDDQIREHQQERRKRLGSLVAWWVILLGTGLLAFAGPYPAAVVMTLISYVGMREYLRMLDSEGQVAQPLIATLLLPLSIHLIAASPLRTLHVALPPLMLLGLSILQWGRSGAQNFAKTNATTFWGIMLIAYGPSWLVRLTGDSTLSRATGGWLVFVIFQVILNDISQALVGRRWGRHKITPKLSPGKTWEGFIGGALITLVAVALMAPLLTPLGVRDVKLAWGADVLTLPAWIGLFGAAAVIVVFGFCGDITMSAIKRDVGVKDTGHWIPSQGGMLDRIDSLTFVAPTVYWYALWIGALP